ncbi:sensor histidine kinase [Ramlibacter tataouinensis]|uniref:histidine kinase n=1 Tax=Ramlibacter tataouinensis (strain ATCC BAA-407 / DSM 14655 / LMG 21543 / TTB310) TaxID=365046 RepID=F5Y5A7_RAMTT|nr:ATP-binding protein [Ramlibacter tataouinensis]AEG91417.1 candidate histidine kinase, classic [Ramlibacter tataouinensis TTB310]
MSTYSWDPPGRAATDAAPAAADEPASPLALLNPRRHLAAAIGWSVFAVVTVAGAGAAHWVGRAAEQQVRWGSEQLVLQLANQTRQTLADSLDNRLSIVQATAAQIKAAGDTGAAALRASLASVQSQFPEFAWLGLADAAGIVVAATGGLLEGKDVSGRPWFQAAAAGPWLGDVHRALMLEKQLPMAPDGQPLRFVDAAVPLHDANGRRLVLGSHLAWRWVEDLQAASLRALSSHEQLELMLVAADGAVLTGPLPWQGRMLHAEQDLTEAGRYIVGQARHEPQAGSPGLAWTVVVRQRSDSVLRPARQAQRAAFSTVLGAALLAAGLAIAATLLLTRRLTRLAAHAQAVHDGRADRLRPIGGIDEVARIGATLAAAVSQLQEEKRALQSLNGALDAKVAERTRRVERLALRNKQVAVVRERLRLARDIHDSLANSLLALLNDIRLMRVLRRQGRMDDFDQRLASAESAASRGLGEARAAITQMRHNNVGEAGLAAALKELLVRFSERTGIAHTLDLPPGELPIATATAEVVFRIAEEAIRNVERHACARSLQVTLAPAGGGAVRLTLADDGVGFDTAVGKSGHYGLQGLREQAALVGGDLGVDSRPGAGTRVTLSFPPG